MTDNANRGEGPADPDQATIAMALTGAAEQYARGRRHGSTGAAARCARELVDRWPGARYRAVMAAVDAVTSDAVRAAWAAGWAPVDVVEYANRRADAAVTGYLVDVIAADSRTYPQATLDHRWHAQLARIDAEVWWAADRGHLNQWAARHGLGRVDALTTVVTALAVLASLPPLERLLPPGTATATAAQRSAGNGGAEEKILAKVRALLAKAESTDFPDEAETLSAKAQELMSRYALNRAMLDHEDGRAQLATARRLWLDNPYLRPKSMLVGAVATANRCRAVFDGGLGVATVVGDEVDLDLVELLTTSLLVQATRAMVGAGRTVGWRGQSRTRSFRHSFLLAYAARIGERLAQTATAETDAARAAESATPQVGGGRLLPVLAARERAVDELVGSMFPRLRRQSVRAGNAAGWTAGRAAADLATLDVHPSVSSVPAVVSPW